MRACTSKFKFNIRELVVVILTKELIRLIKITSHNDIMCKWSVCELHVHCTMNAVILRVLALIPLD